MYNFVKELSIKIGIVLQIGVTVSNQNCCRNYAVDGYMLNKYRSGQIIPAEIEKEIEELIDLWKKIYTERED